jgi:hypothetical protein
MKQAHQQSKKSLWLVTGLSLLGGAAWPSCQPGELPCDLPEWQDLQACKGGAGGMGGSGGTTPMGGAGGGGAMVTKDTEVKDCNQWKTLGEMDRFFTARCAAGGGSEGASCHVTTNAAAWSDLASPDIWKRVKDVDAKFSCKGAKLINSKTWSESVIWAKVQPGDGPPTCPPGGSTPNVRMPPQDGTFKPVMAVLSADELKCLENFLRAIAGTPP